jgi:hypothetical protein
MPGEAVTVFSLSLPSARFVEQFIHLLCTPLSMRWFGSGKSEWFLFPALLVAIPIMLIAAFFEVALICVVVFIFLKFLIL